MPYIKQESRDFFDHYLNQINIQNFKKGDLTYCLYRLCINYMEGRTKNYENLSSTMSCLEDAKLEWYRKRIAPYEDEKIFENGDIQ